MQALILVGGRGTRLLPLTAQTPKPVVTLVDRPFLAFMIEWLARHGVDEVVLASGFRADRLEQTLGDSHPAGVRIRYVEEAEPLGTAGAIRNALPLLRDRFIALNGDLLTDLDLGALLDFHQDRTARATIALQQVADTTGFGVFSMDETGGVTGFREKEPEASAGLVNAGVYVLERSVVEQIP
jgi:mannose-1-phosphate guanylyltransferase